MKNIWCIFGIVVIVAVILLIAAILIFIRRKKYYVLSGIFVLAMAAVLLVLDIPYIKDLAQQETTEVVAVYVKYQTGNVDPGAKRLFFKNGKNEFDLLAPTITKDCVKMKVGKKYKIEYFNNSKVIKKYELIE